MRGIKPSEFLLIVVGILFWTLLMLGALARAA